MSAEVAPAPSSTDVAPCSLRQLVLYFLRLGAVGFGGPIALAGAMQRDLVERRRWISEADFLDGLALAQLAPGPLAAQLAIFLGWVRGGFVGATLVGVAFVLPSFLMVLGLSALYVAVGGMSWMQGAFYGVGAAVIALVARGAYKLAKMTLKRDALLWSVFVVNAAVTGWTESELVWLFVGSGALVAIVRASAPTASVAAVVPGWLVTGASGPAATSTLSTILLTFTKAGAFVFGSGLAIVPFLRGAVVDELRWLNDQQFLDAVAVAMITPGPVVITVAFIGYLVAGPLGAALAAVGTFLPCWLLVVLPAPYFRRFSSNARLKAFVAGVTAAASGAIAGAAFVLGRRAIVDVPAALLFAATLVVLWRTKKAPEPLVIVVAGALGFALHGLSWP